MWSWPVVGFVCGIIVVMFVYNIWSWAYFEDDKRTLMLATGLGEIVAFFGWWASWELADEEDRSLTFNAGLAGMAVGAVLRIAVGDVWWIFPK